MNEYLCIFFGIMWPFLLYQFVMVTQKKSTFLLLIPKSVWVTISLIIQNNKKSCSRHTHTHTQIVGPPPTNPWPQCYVIKLFPYLWAWLPSYSSSPPTSYRVGLTWCSFPPTWWTAQELSEFFLHLVLISWQYLFLCCSSRSVTLHGHVFRCYTTCGLLLQWRNT